MYEGRVENAVSINDVIVDGSDILVQSLSHVQLFATPGTAARQASLSISKSHSLLKLMSIKSVMPSKYLVLYHPLLLLPSIFSKIRVFPQCISSLHQVAKVIFRTDFLQN